MLGLCMKSRTQSLKKQLVVIWHQIVKGNYTTIQYIHRCGINETKQTHRIGRAPNDGFVRQSLNALRSYENRL
ncbi:hypothetical protein D3C77_565860 [compost metagenome]